jgi:acetate kinase
MKILVLNSGSSSQKTALFDLQGRSQEPLAPLWRAEIEWQGNEASATSYSPRGKSKDRFQAEEDNRSAALRQILERLWSGKSPILASIAEIKIVGHRVVHGGPKLREPAIINAEVKKNIADAADFAPLHNREELDGIAMIEHLLPQIPQVAVFDTGFHRTLPPAAMFYPGPYEWRARGIQRYGFHGINHQYCAQRVAYLMKKELAEMKIVSCHLGNGCSLAAIDGGRSVETTMGFTPLEGLMMGTRSGSIDPGIITYLLRQDKTTAEEMDDLLNKQSGLKGISGISHDMREVLHAMQAGDERARLAFDMFVHRLQTGIGAMSAALNGCDALVFTAGIGENSPEVRSSVCERLQFFGVCIDSKKNAEPCKDQDISASGSRVRVFTVRAQEDWAIAHECLHQYQALQDAQSPLK